MEENYIDATMNEMLKVKSDYTNINDLIRWSRKTLQILKSNPKGDGLKYILIKTILTRLSNIYFDVTAFEKDFVEEELNQDLINYFDEEFSDIYEFLSGKKSYYNVYVIKENYLEKNNELFKPILDFAMKVIKANIISDEEINYISENINSISITSKRNIIYCEIAQAIINANKAQKRISKIISVDGYGLNRCELSYKGESKLIESLLYVIKGEKKYRLSIGLNKLNVLFTNIHVIED